MIKNRNYIILILIIFVFFSCNKPKESINVCNVSGNISGFLEGKIVLYRLLDNNLLAIDSSFVIQNKFNFKNLNITEPEVYYFICGDNIALLECFLEPGDIQLNADVRAEKKLTVLGSKSQNEYSSFLENNSVYENKQKQLYQQKNTALQNADTAMLSIIDSSLLSIFDEQILFMKEYVKANKNSVIALYVTAGSLKNFIGLEELKSISSSFSKSLHQSIYFSQILQDIQIKERIEVGLQAPDFSLPDIKGKIVSLSSFQGKYVLLDFSASWQENTKIRNLYLKNIYKKYRNFDFDIFTVSMEYNKNIWFKEMRTQEIDWIQTSDMKGTNSEIFRLFGISNLPSTFLLDKKGIIIAKNLSKTDLESQLKKIFYEEN
jgi:peroxiredoxin